MTKKECSFRDKIAQLDSLKKQIMKNQMIARYEGTCYQTNPNVINQIVDLNNQLYEGNAKSYSLTQH